MVDIQKKHRKTNVKINILGSAEGQVGVKIGPKMGPKTENPIRCILTSIFDRFWSILGPKLGWEMELKPIKNRYQNRSKKGTASKRALDGSKRLRHSLNFYGLAMTAPRLASSGLQDRPGGGD